MFKNNLTENELRTILENAIIVSDTVSGIPKDRPIVIPYITSFKPEASGVLKELIIKAWIKSYRSGYGYPPGVPFSILERDDRLRDMLALLMTRSQSDFLINEGYNVVLPYDRREHYFTGSSVYISGELTKLGKVFGDGPDIINILLEYQI